MLCARFGLNWYGGSREEVENVKSVQTDDQTDDRQETSRKAHFSFQLKRAKY